MKDGRIVLTLLFLLLNGACDQQPSQQTKADRRLVGGLRAKAQRGDAKAQFGFGVAFANGDFGLAKDDVESVKWYRKAAEQDYAPAQHNLGLCYRDGRGVTKDEQEAVK